jgi:hypothetical protein
MSPPPDAIVCVECGGEARLMSFVSEDEPLDPGTSVVYHCPDCYGRFDVVWGEDE